MDEESIESFHPQVYAECKDESERRGLEVNDLFAAFTYQKAITLIQPGWTFGEEF